MTRSGHGFGDDGNFWPNPKGPSTGLGGRRSRPRGTGRPFMDVDQAGKCPLAMGAALWWPPLAGQDFGTQPIGAGASLEDLNGCRIAHPALARWERRSRHPVRRLRDTVVAGFA